MLRCRPCAVQSACGKRVAHHGLPCCLLKCAQGHCRSHGAIASCLIVRPVGGVRPNCSPDHILLAVTRRNPQPLRQEPISRHFQATGVEGADCRAARVVLDAVFRGATASEAAKVDIQSTILEPATRTPPVPSRAKDSSHNARRNQAADATEVVDETVSNHSWETWEIPPCKFLPDSMVRAREVHLMDLLARQPLELPPHLIGDGFRPRSRNPIRKEAHKRLGTDALIPQGFRIPAEGTRNGCVKPLTPANCPPQVGSGRPCVRQSPAQGVNVEAPVRGRLEVKESQLGCSSGGRH